MRYGEHQSNQRERRELKPYEWVKANYDWLVKWFDDCEPVDKSELKDFKDTDCHIFRTILYKQSDYDKSLRDHITSILLGLIWGRKFRMVSVSQVLTGGDGFYRQRNRLPIPSDKVKIRYFGEDKKGMRMLRFSPNHDMYPVGEFLSDCKIEIL